MLKRTITEIYTSFKPNGLAVGGDLSYLKQDISKTNLLIYGEIHGVAENARLVFSLIKKLKVKQLGVECDSETAETIIKIAEEDIDIEKINSDIFDSSIVSIEMLKTIVIAIKLGYLEKIIPLDTFYDKKQMELNNMSSEERERMLTENILRIKLTSKTMCIMGAWHTKDSIVHNTEGNDTSIHTSSYLRVRQNIPSVTVLEVNYNSGTLYNCGEYIHIPETNISIDAGLKRVKPFVYEMRLSEARPIEVFQSS